MNAREEILTRVRAQLAGVRPAPLPAESVAAAPDEPIEARIARFTEQLERTGGRAVRVRNVERASRVLATQLAEWGVRDAAVSDGPLARRAAAGSGSIDTFDGSRDRARLLRCGAGVTEAQWAVAETGTIVLQSDAERHRLASLVPPAHVAIVPTARIVATLGDALAKCAVRGSAAAMSRAVTFITGPSRTADIELTLVVGVHGPKQLLVLLLDDAS